eukprot:Gb_02232 [translate_table: standard]
MEAKVSMHGYAQKITSLVHLNGPKSNSSGNCTFNVRKSTDFGYKRIKSMHLKSRTKVFCVLAKPPGRAAPMGQKTEYNDGWIDTMAINYLCKCVQDATGKRTDLNGYDGLLDVVSKTVQSFSPVKQQELVVYALRLAVPNIFLRLSRMFLHPSKFTWEYYAASTPFLFRWLVGPCEVKETEIDGVKQRSVVHIKKCRFKFLKVYGRASKFCSWVNSGSGFCYRFLESTNCVGMCVNLCKIPTQQFIAQDLGAPVTMTPNFEDMSCEMVFGQHPPPMEEDPALKQPCYKTLCK